MGKGWDNPLYCFKSTLMDPTFKEALIRMGILFLSDEIQRVKLSFSLKTLPDCTEGLIL